MPAVITILKRNIGFVFDFFLPRFCASCERHLEENERVICSTCDLKLTVVAEETLRNEYERKFAGEKIISDFYSPFVFSEETPIRDIIHKLKYEKRFQNGLYLGEKIAEYGKDIFASWKINLIIPIPLHKIKKAERGYNQSAYIAKGISLKTGIPVSERAVKRVKYTQSQTKLNLVERKENMLGVFTVRDKSKIKDKNILLIDDVITTGATISECAATIRKGGAAKIYAVSSAIA